MNGTPSRAVDDRVAGERDKILKMEFSRDKIGNLECGHKITCPPVEVEIAVRAVRGDGSAHDAQKAFTPRIKYRGSRTVNVSYDSAEPCSGFGGD